MLDGDQFRRVMGRFAAGVTVVTLPEPYHGITVNAFASLSLDPPLVLVCIDHDTETHDRLAGDTEAYCVNFLTSEQRHLGEHFAGIVELDEDPFRAEATRSAVTGAPVFEGGLAYVDCSLHDAVTAGDHTIYVGAAEGAEVLRDDVDPLAYYNRQWGTFAPAE